MGIKTVFSTIGVMVAIALLTFLASSAAACSTRIELLNPLPDGILEVGETYTFDIEIKHGTPFILAMAVPDVYYPGRAIIFRGNDIVHRDNSALLQLTMTGKGSTADFAAVENWPENGVNWPEGVVPVSIVVGVRFKKGVVISERFDFAVEVP